MNKKEHVSIADNVTIDVFDYLWNMVSQWKMIAIVALVISLLAVGFKYRSDLKTYESSDVQTVTVDSLEESMTEAEISTVDYAIRQKRLIDKYEDYMNISPMYGMDPTQLKVAHVEYLVSTSDEGVAASVVDAMDGYLASTDFVEGIAAMMANEEQRVAVGDLIQVEKPETGSHVITVEIVLSDGMDGATVCDYVANGLERYSQQLVQAGLSHELVSLSNEVRTIIASDFIDDQSDLVQSTISLRGLLQSYTEIFNENQKNLYNLKIEEIESSNHEQAEITVEPEKPHLSKKVLLMGFFVGIILYAFVYLVLTLFKNRIKTAKECEDTLDIRTLGELHGFHEKGFGRLLSSKFVYKRKYAAFSDVELQKNRIVDSLVAYVAKHPDAKMQFTSVASLTDAENAYLDDMVCLLREKGIDTEVYTGDIRKDTSFHQNLARANQMILVLCKNRSVYSDIDLCLDLAKESGIDVVGSVFVDC
jgi:capsular polysaccharide biosynthesis protein